MRTQQVFLSMLLACFSNTAFAADSLKPGQEKKSAVGIEKVLAVTKIQADSYWVASFVRDGNCPESSGKCATDSIYVRGPGGQINLPLEDASGTTAMFSNSIKPLGAVIIPENRAGYGYASVEVFAFNTENKPVSVLKSADYLLNNLEGAACAAKQLCAESKLSVNFINPEKSQFPELQIRQTGTAMRADGNALERIDRIYSFSYDMQAKRYNAKR